MHKKEKKSLIEFFNEQEGITDVVIYYDYQGGTKVKRNTIIGALAGLIFGIAVRLLRRKK